MNGLLVDGPTPDELTRAREAERASVRECLSALGWMGSRIDLLGRGLLFAGDPDAYLRRLERQATLSATDVREAGVRWLARPDFTIHVRPTITPDQ